jgi:hypothetical protein
MAPLCQSASKKIGPNRRNWLCSEFNEFWKSNRTLPHGAEFGFWKGVVLVASSAFRTADFVA